MKLTTLSAISAIFLLGFSTLASANNAKQVYDWTATLAGDWKLGPADMQIGKATTKGPAAKLMNTDGTAMSFKVIGRGTTIQETLLPGTKKEMVTMYHCYDKQCSWVKATHYCAKKNQPEMKAAPKESSASKMVFNCDMNTELCNSDDDHVHKITHELMDNNTLKTTYESYKDGFSVKKSSYIFVRK